MGFYTRKLHPDSTRACLLTFEGGCIGAISPRNANLQASLGWKDWAGAESVVCSSIFTRVAGLHHRRPGPGQVTHRAYFRCCSLGFVLLRVGLRLVVVFVLLR
jgi:hypothetical protein